jgi:hypothetical protein
MSSASLYGYVCVFDGKPVLATARSTEEKCWQHQLEVLGVTKEVAQARSWDVVPMRMTVGRDQVENMSYHLTILGMKLKIGDQVIISGNEYGSKRLYTNMDCSIHSYEYRTEVVHVVALFAPSFKRVISFRVRDIHRIERSKA